MNEYYEQLANYLREESKAICGMNECTEDKHNCDSYAYFDYDSDSKEFSLATICCPDYAQKCYDSYVLLPFVGSGQGLFKELEDNLLEDLW